MYLVSVRQRVTAVSALLAAIHAVMCPWLTVHSPLCLLAVQVPCVTQFEAQLMIVELLEHNPVFTVSR